MPANANKKGKLTSKEKAAVLMVMLGTELSAKVLKNLDDEQIEQLTLEIANLREISSEERKEVCEEFHNMLAAKELISRGGISYAKEVLERALGPEKAMEVLNKLTSSLQVKPFEFIRKTDPSQLLNFLQNEHPQTIALILSYMEPDQASALLSSLPEELQPDVAKRIALMDRTSPETIREVEKLLERKLSTYTKQDFSMVGGVTALVDIMNKVDRGTERRILETLEGEEPELAEEIKKKMFVFEDIVKLSDRDIQLVTREIEMHDMAVALKGAGDDVKQKIFNNMSKRAVSLLQEEMEFMGPVRVRDVEEAQQKIVAVIRRLEEAGEIVISRGGGEELIV